MCSTKTWSAFACKPLYFVAAELSVTAPIFGENVRSAKRLPNEQEINVPRGRAGIRFEIMSVDADTNPAPSLASGTWIQGGRS